MCLAIPGRVVELHGQHGELVALVDFDGTTRKVVVTFVPEVQLGDYVIVHAGVALQRLDEAAAAETLALFAEMGDGEPV
jgi:hydrogenase expression/formation protein HypC